jgi:glucose-6-phosphate 1-epimerase
MLTGAGGLPKLRLTAPDGARAEVYLHGAHVTSWLPAGASAPGGPAERLFLSRRAEFAPGSAIRGGVPVIFPQFGGFGPLLKHGFARLLEWQLAETGVSSGEAGAGPAGAASAHLRLAANDEARRLWPHDFQAELTVSVGGPQLTLALALMNTGAGPFEFTAGLHTYLNVGDIGATEIDGLGGLAYLDAAADGRAERQAQPVLRFAGEVDRVYWDVPGELRLRAPAGGAAIGAEGFPDTVVWNPGPAKGAAFADLEPDGYLRFACVEAAVIGRPVRLAPGERWQGAQWLRALPQGEAGTTIGG